MPEYGINILNSAGNTIVDCIDPCYFVEQTAVVTPTTPGRGVYTATFNFNRSYAVTSPPICAVASVVLVAFRRYILTGGVITGVELCSGDGTPFNIAVLASAKDVSAPSGMYGMVVFNSAGEKTYDSRFKIFVPVGAITVPAANGSFAKVASPGLTYYILNALDGKRVITVGGVYFTLQGIKTVDSVTCSTGWVTMISLPFIPGQLPYTYGGTNRVIYGVIR